MRYSGVVLCLLSLAGYACRASVNANANAQFSGEAESRADVQDEPDAPTPVAAAAPEPTPASAPAGSDRPLLGARHDLSLVAERATASCNCLDVALGPASAGSFRWQGGAPRVDPETQLVVALSTTEAHCTKPKKKQYAEGASYWGYRLVGNDVVVFVEAAVRGRPRTEGAIIPKPVGDGQVWVAPVSKNVPFGKPLDGKGTQCRLGNPGPPRTTPLTPEELGTNTEPRAPAPEPAGAESSSDWTQ